ncbi:RNA-directed DNA polymerase, eukaryota, reverse transcriptase zinc-binding domain protein [Tanacetum coccineum]
MKPPRRLLKLPLKPQIESPTTSVVRPPRPTPTKKVFQNLRYEAENLLTELESDCIIGYLDHGYKIRKNQNQTLLISTADLERVPPQNADLLTGEGKFISRISVGHPSTISRRAASLKTFSMLPRCDPYLDKEQTHGFILVYSPALVSLTFYNFKLLFHYRVTSENAEARIGSFDMGNDCIIRLSWAHVHCPEDVQLTITMFEGTLIARNIDVLTQHGFLSQKGSGGGRGVKEKNKGVAAKDGVSPSMTVEPVGSTLTRNAPGKSSYANITGKPSGKKVNVRTFFTPEGNGIDVVVLMDSIRAISERFANTAYGVFLGKKVAYPVVANYVRNTWGSIDGLDAMLENGPWFMRNNPLILKKWHPDENLLKEDVSTVPVWVKLHGVPVTAFSEDGLSVVATKLGTPLKLDSNTSNICMQSWGRSSYARVMIELRAHVELKKTLSWLCLKLLRRSITHVMSVLSAGEKKTVKKPSQTSRGVLVGPKIGFKPQKEYRPVPKKPNASSSGNKKKGVEPTIEVSNSNPFDVLNSVDNDVEFGTNRGTTNLVNNGATSSGSSFMNIDNDGEFASNTPIGEKIDKIERQICEGKLEACL